MKPATDVLRTRAAELESRVPPATAGPRTDDEHLFLEKAAALRAEANALDAAASCGHEALLGHQEPEA
ncbi:hypothetical protein ACIO3O_37485 [Streptomyces sp. NPDC087440]|uniref:hypothetical protein n=1 Tax=Streptomyces sp. NPDC087440 TaxID=3365790 RepID=UPI0038190EA2